jgi:hypothetical protein
MSDRARDRDNLERQRDRLYERLEEDYEQIEQGLAEGDDITVRAYEGFWVELLHEYERACKELQVTA